MSDYLLTQAIQDIRLIFNGYMMQFEAGLNYGYKSALSSQSSRTIDRFMPSPNEDAAREDVIRAYQAGIFYPAAYYAGLKHASKKLFTKRLLSAFEMLGFVYTKTLSEVYSDHPLTQDDLLNSNVVISFDASVGYAALLSSVFHEIFDIASSVKIFVHDPRFLPLLQRSFPRAIVEVAPPKIERMREIFAQNNTIGLQSFSALFVMRRRFSDFPSGQNACIVPDPRKVKFWKRRVEALGNGLKIGISWKTKTKFRQRQRTMHLVEWENLLRLPGAIFCSLQYGPCVDDLNEVRSEFGVQVHNFPDADPLKDLEGIIAGISALDVVISTDQSMVYLACALGKPTLMLMHSDGYPLWGGWDDTPWWNSLRIIRQETRDDWEPVIARAVEEVIHFQESGTFTPISPERSYKTFFKILEGEAER